ELLPIALLPGSHGNESLIRFPLHIFVGHGTTPAISTAGSRHWMPIFLKRFTAVSTCHSQKTPGTSGTRKKLPAPSDTILHNALRDGLSFFDVSNPSLRKKLPQLDVYETKLRQRPQDVTRVRTRL